MAYGTKAQLYGGVATTVADKQLFETKIVYGATSTIASQRSNWCTVTKTGTGTFKVQFAANYGLLLGLTVGWTSPLGTALQAQVTDESNLASNGYLTVKTFSGTTPTDPTSGDALMMTFSLNDNPVNNASR